MKEQLIEIINLYRIKKLNNNANAEKLEDVIFRMELVIDDSNINCDFNKIHQVLNEVLGQEGTSSIITNLNDYLSLMNLSVTYNVNRAIDECKHKCYSDIQTLTLEAESLKLDLEKIQKCDLLISQLQTEKPIADIYFVANILKQTGLELNQQNELLIWLANYNLTLPSSLEINRLNAEAFSPLSEDEKIMYLLVEQNINNYNDQIVSDIKNYVGITNLELAFAIFNNYNFDLSKIDIEILLQILIKSNSNNLETIFKFITDKKIDHEILISYPGLFIKNENNLSNNKKGLKFKTKIIGLQDSFIKIYEFFENLNYDMETFTQKGRSVLLSNFNTISHNFAILKQYQFNVEPNQEGKSNLPFSVFKINNLDQMIDSYIEEGLNSYIHSAPSLLNNNFAYKKVHLKRKYNEPYENKNHLVKEINSQKKEDQFKISGMPIINSQLDQIINSDTENHLTSFKLNPYCAIINSTKIYDYTPNEWIDLLDINYKKSPLEYEISGKTISRNKVICNINRILAKVEKDAIDIECVLISSIIYNSLLTKEQIITIENEIKELVKRKVKVKE